jgi:hypothetical protein
MACGFGFTRDLFRGWLWKDGDTVMISFIESLHPGQGNLSRLFKNIEAIGLRVAVPLPMGRAIARAVRAAVSSPVVGAVALDADRPQEKP